MHERLVALAGSRYDDKTGILKVVGIKRAERAQNKAQALALLRSLLAEAWKADVNFVPTIDPIAPHQKVERELQADAEVAAKAAAREPQSFLRPDLVLFRLRSFPEPKTRAVSDILQRLSK